jgi:lipopolysaccharide transport system ATP-binding protein
MSSNPSPSIAVEGVSKCYRIFERPQDRLLQGLWLGKKNFYREFWALNGIDFTVGKGETVGIIGRNGSGKSTLLQIISGTLSPTTGQVSTSGRVSGLLELGAGFNPEFTGRENVFLSAALLGLSSAETEERFNEIAAFADIGEFLDQPLKFYSSGMLVRLGFAVQTVLEPAVLVVDEALAVGDARFQKKCYDYIDGFRKRGGTILFVTHDTGIIVQICDWAMVLEKGKIFDSGEPHKIAKEYHRLLFGNADQGPAAAEKVGALEMAEGMRSQENEASDDPVRAVSINTTETARELRYGSQSVVATQVGIRDQCGGLVNIVETRQSLEVFFEVEYRCDIIEEVAYGFVVTNSKGLEVYGTKSGLHGIYLPAGAKGQRFECSMEMKVLMVPGSYFLTVALAPKNPSDADEFFDLRFDALEFKVIGNPPCFATAVIDLEAQLSHEVINN